MAGYFIAFFWGFAEATLFFIIPDVWISLLALQSRNEALLGCLYSLAGAMLGGAVMYFLGRKELQRWNTTLEKIPAIHSRDILKVQSDLKSSGAASVLFGPLFGIPYKIYAVNAHSVMSIASFMLISIPAREIRFALIALFTDFVSRIWLAGFSLPVRVGIVLTLWAITYTVYFFIKRR